MPDPLSLPDPSKAAPKQRSLAFHFDFRQLWVGDTISQVGGAVSGLAIPYIAVTLLAATEFQMGLLEALLGLGFLIVGLPAGAWVDRWRKRRVMISADIFRAGALFTVVAAIWMDALSLAHLMAAAVGVGVATVFFDVSYQSFVPGLVGRDRVVEGNAKLQGSQSVAQSGGPALGGLLLKYVGAGPVIAINAFSFLFSALFLWRIRHREETPAMETRRPLRVEIAEGLTFVLKHPLLIRLVLCTGIGNLAHSAAGALFVLYLVRDLHLSALTIGIVESAAAIGGLMGALLTRKLANLTGEGPAIIVSATAMMTTAFCYPLASLWPAIPTLIIGGVFLYASLVIYNVATVSFRQRLCPPELLGRMNATVRFLIWGTIPIGAMLGGILGHAFGAITAIWIATFLGLLALLPVYISPLWRLKKLPGADSA